MLTKKIGVLAVSVAVCAGALAGMPAPAMAQAATGDEVELTFRLDVEGDVPGWQHFAVEYYPAGGQPGKVPLCTTAADEGPAGPRCEGGEAYTANVEVPAGNRVTYRFLRHDTRTAPEYFEQAARAFDDDTTVGASYVFPGGAIPQEPDDKSAAHDQYEDAITPSDEWSAPVTPEIAPIEARYEASTSDDPVSEAAFAAEDNAAEEQYTGNGSAEDQYVDDVTSQARHGSPVMGITILPDTGGVPSVLIPGALLIAVGGGFFYRRLL